MRDEFPGYYRPTDKEFEELWERALIVTDANVLLTLYRLGDTTRERLLEILRKLEQRLFLPYQAGYEFQKNRLNVIQDQEAVYGTVNGEIEKFPKSLGRRLREHPRLDRKDLEVRLDEALKPVKAYVDEVRGQHPDPLSEDVIGADAVRDVLDEVFAGKVGPKRDLYGLVETGATRYERKQPPGYEDKDKDEPARYGDLAIWLDTIDAAKRESKDVIFVTAERKEDWWWVRDGQRVSARPELIAEMREQAGQSVYLYDIKRFMEEASKALGLSEISEDERKDVARAQKASFTHIPAELNLRLQDWIRASEQIKPLSEVDASNLTWPALETSVFRWQSDTHVGSDGVGLRLDLKPEIFVPRALQVSRQVSCLVTGPEGGESLATVHIPGYSAAFTYPQDFNGVIEDVEGAYDYAWHVRGGGDGFSIPSGKVATGGFDLTGPTPDENAEPA